MKICHLGRKPVWLSVLASTLTLLPAAEVISPSTVPFAEVFGLVKSNLAGANDAELNRAAVLGFLSQLQPRVMLVTNGSSAVDVSTVPLVTKTAVFDRSYGFLRIGRVGPGLAKEVKNGLAQLNSSNQLTGVIIDLRFTLGQDYAAAAETADLFFKTEQPLLKWGDTTVRSTAKTNAFDLPIAILINRDTVGAAEALAAALRQAQGALIIGSGSAGQAYVFRDVTLSNGQILRIASGWIQAGNGQALAETGVTPDIRIDVKLADEKAYFEDPYRILAKPFAQAAKPATNELSGLQSTNRMRRRVNEAELVRMQREGADLEGEPLTASSPQPGGPVVTDPALSRALDLLKGLALAYKRQ